MTQTRIKRASLILPACLAFLAIPVAAKSAERATCTISGEWRGAVDFPRPDGRPALHALVAAGFSDGGRTAFRFAIPHRGLTHTIPPESCSGREIRTSFTIEGEPVRLHMTSAGERMSGTLAKADDAYTFTLRQIGDFGPPALLRGAEFLTDNEGRWFALGASGKAITFYEGATNRVRRFYPRASNDDYISGQNIRSLEPITAQLQVVDDGSGAMTLKLAEGPVSLRRTETFRRTPVQFEGAEGAALAGELLIPASGAPAPGVVVVAGSGRQDRWGFGALQAWKAAQLAQAGFAVLVFDKRGVGESGGAYETRDFNLLAEDTAKAVEFLAAQPTVDATRTGALVHSQSGMYGGLIAARTDALKFLIALGPSITNGKIQEIQRTADTIRADGYPATDAAAAAALQILKFHYADYRLSWDAYTLHRAALEDAPWFDMIVGPPDDPELEVWDFWRSINAYEPADDYAGIDIPVLVLYGEHDVISPVAPSIALLEKAFSGERRSLLEIGVVPGANHALYLARDGGLIAESDISEVSPFMETAIDWLERLGFAP